MNFKTAIKIAHDLKIKKIALSFKMTVLKHNAMKNIYLEKFHAKKEMAKTCRKTSRRTKALLSLTKINIQTKWWNRQPAWTPRATAESPRLMKWASNCRSNPLRLKIFRIQILIQVFKIFWVLIKICQILILRARISWCRSWLARSGNWVLKKRTILAELAKVRVIMGKNRFTLTIIRWRVRQKSL